MDILGSQVYPVVQMLFPKNDAIFQEGDLPIHTARIVQSWFEEHEDALQHLLWLAQSPDLNIIQPLVSFREQGENQIPSNICQVTRRRVVQYSTRDYSELTWVYSKKDTSCVTGRWWLNSTLIKKCASFTAVSIIFVHPLYMLSNYIPLGDWINFVEMYLCK